MRESTRTPRPMFANAALPFLCCSSAVARRCRATRVSASMNRGFTPSGHAGMQLPLPEHTCAQRADSGAPSPPRMRSSTPPTTSAAFLPAMPAGAVIGHTSKQRPQRVHRSSTSCVRASSASANVSLIGNPVMRET
ncbi:hypothetical protein D3C83_07570 [compost metagenome]